MKKIKKVLIIGSGPIVIGQAAEFDYSGTQALLACREANIQTIIVNSNPATIQTDYEMADIVYIEPLTVATIEKIFKKEKPDAIIPTVGGQTALNLAVELEKKNIFKKYDVTILGTSIDSIKKGEDRGLFKKAMEKMSIPVLPSIIIQDQKDAIQFSKKIGFPLIMRSPFSLGGTGSGMIINIQELKQKIHQGVLLEKSIYGWSEFEFEVIRDALGNKIIVCSMENVDPMGIHTGESIVVAPIQTLPDIHFQTLRNASFKIVDALEIIGACNIQFAWNYKTNEFVVIEVNPRLSRSSALASKASGYPIARVATKIALGFTLHEIINDITGKTAFFEPALDYIVLKIPRWPHDKFPELETQIGITMKSTGEVMAIGRTFEEALYKAIESLDVHQEIVEKGKFEKKLKVPNVHRLNYILQALSSGMSIDRISRLTKIHLWFIKKMQSFVEKRSKVSKSIQTFHMVDTCAGEFVAKTPYFYSTHGDYNEAIPLSGAKVIIIGSGPIRIGQGIEFDYMTVHAVKALRDLGIRSIIVNNNPETVSTDYSISDRLYFEPLTFEFVSKIIQNERKDLLGVIVQFGGQTAIRLADDIQKMGIPILGTQPLSIRKAEHRKSTSSVLKQIGCTIPKWISITPDSNIKKKIKDLHFPLIIRPSFVLGGEGMKIVNANDEVTEYFKHISSKYLKNTILIDEFIDSAMEVDIDFISDGIHVESFILEQLEPAGIHSGDSICIFPAENLSESMKKQLQMIAEKISKAFSIIGLGNIQCALKNEKIYVLEVNPRASRTIPFLSKCLGISLTQIATEILMGKKLNKKIFKNLNIKKAMKIPVFSFEKLHGISQELSPVMKSTGEMMEYLP